MRLTCQQSSWHHLTGNEISVLGLPDGTRSDAFTYDDKHMPVGGLNLETLSAEQSLMFTKFSTMCAFGTSSIKVIMS
ncbi:hypothetical protein C5467_09475 [Photorhabdus khanii subsp. guanajuatensis]|uniref:Uncharacterized protein n=1 Tax=Photorhabdus khanii subsp. guanajuatensis TaxID=2100166 RepID=A0A4R4JZG6_9GAMM|nr:hypothetical protein C5467_09475 [Photorhabdus khanii subsp. guanajuatensis]